MRRMLLAIAVTIAAASTAQADCKDEVAAALERQRKTSGFSMETQMITADGKVDMTVDYVLPDRMRQIIKSQKDPVAIETVLIGERAWSRREGESWTMLNPQLTSALSKQLEDTLGDTPGELGEFECLGKKDLDGKALLAYQGENESGGPKDLSEGAKDKPKLPNRPVRIIYVDSTTGLPMQSIFARANLLEKPIFVAKYSYPADLKIEVPPPPKR
jgi:outer membrane lipoprotein-sorting protein